MTPLCPDQSQQEQLRELDSAINSWFAIWFIPSYNIKDDDQRDPLLTAHCSVLLML